MQADPTVRATIISGAATSGIAAFLPAGWQASGNMPFSGNDAVWLYAAAVAVIICAGPLYVGRPMQKPATLIVLTVGAGTLIMSFVAGVQAVSNAYMPVGVVIAATSGILIIGGAGRQWTLLPARSEDADGAVPQPGRYPPSG